MQDALADWALLFYGVAVDPAGRPDNALVGYLDGELRSFVSGCTGTELPLKATLKELAESFASARPGHVRCAYQVDYLGKAGCYGQRQVVGATRDADYPPRKPYRKPQREWDFEAFLRWASTTCKAKRLALVIFGHGSGPAGLFDLDGRNAAKPAGSKSPPFPRPDLEIPIQSVRQALKSWWNDGDIVLLLKSCWMANVETACELATEVKLMIASQSVVSLAMPWDYRRVVASLSPSATQSIAASLHTIVTDTYPNGDPDRNGLVPPFSLLDLGEADAIAAALKAIVSLIGAPRGRSQDQKAASAAFDQCLTGPFTGEGRDDSGKNGDVALVDLSRVAHALERVNGFQLVATQLELAVARTVVQRPTDRLCTGISVFRWPPASLMNRKDEWIIPHNISIADYRNTRFNILTCDKDRSLGYADTVGFEHA